MKFRLEKVPRRPSWPWWAVAMTLVWLALVGTAAFVESKYHQDFRLCLFKRITGVPCPTCGSTRGCLSILAGDVGGAWRYNPLLFTVLSIALASLLLRLTFARRVRIEMSRTERIVVRTAIIILVAVNWAYVICYVG